MSVDLGTISFELTPQSIRKAMQDYLAFAKRFRAALDRLMEQLTQEGVTVAKINLVSATGDMDILASEVGESIQGVYFPTERCGYIMSNKPEAVYLEYGTGIIGQHNFHVGAAIGESTPPVMIYTTLNGDTRTYTGYDTYGHGSEGWHYYNDDGERVHTLGVPAGMFFYNTLKWLKERAPYVMEEQLRKKG